MTECPLTWERLTARQRMVVGLMIEGLDLTRQNGLAQVTLEQEVKAVDQILKALHEARLLKT